jgi:hypothetical protein
MSKNGESHLFVHLFHLLIVGSLFLYVGIARESIPKWMYPVLLVLGAVIVVYHIYKIVLKMQKGKGYWVNLIHILFVAPLLIYIGYYKKETSRKYYELLLMLGFAAIGYHGYYMVKGDS